jgi:hypothetical protein
MLRCESGKSKPPKTEVAKVDELIKFLKRQFQILESIENARKLDKSEQERIQTPMERVMRDIFQGKIRTLITHTATVKIKCYFCEEPHCL